MRATKVCTMCGEEKPIEQFSWKVKAKGERDSRCKLCKKEVRRQYYLKNIDREKERKRQWRRENKDKVRESFKRWCAENPDKVREKRKRYYGKYKDEIYEKRMQRRRRHPKLTRVQIKRHNKRYRSGRFKERLKNDKEFALRYRLNNTIKNSIRASLKGNKNRYSWESLVGYTLADLMAHLESQFKPGMTWDNYGEWHIDHIRPIASFSFTSPDDPEFRECWALENLQPLWAEENLRKGAKVI